jgi:hypothetical protein
MRADRRQEISGPQQGRLTAGSHDGRFVAADFARFGLPAALPLLKRDE